jgi:thioesterase domain-containing protein/acyl carrier protein
MSELTNSKIVGPALAIIAEESGIAISELTDDSNLADMGIDSLLMLVISSRFREELSLDVDLVAMFSQLHTIGHLKRYLDPAAAVIPAALARELQPEPTPVISVSPDVVEASHQPTNAAKTTGLESADFATALQIISEESGIAVSDLTEDSVFSDIGVDSLLSLVIVSRLREEFSFELELGSLFNVPTVKDLKNFLLGGSPSDCSSESESWVGLSSRDNSEAETKFPIPSDSPNNLFDSSAEKHEKPFYVVRPATSVIVQGLPKTTKKTLFLFPDGGGSAAPYSTLHRVHPDICIIGLNSPYARHPEEMKCGLDELITSYLTEIRRRQPTGPYYFGGWSVGGIFAYRATYELIQQGEVVRNLVLIDSPTPRGLDKLPQRFYDFCNDLGLFGRVVGTSAADTPEWLVPHFNATIDILHEYFADPLPKDKVQKASLIWACQSLTDGKGVPELEPQDGDPEGMKFLMETRTNFSACGWETLFPGGEVIVEKAEGQNHFSMMVCLPFPCDLLRSLSNDLC